MRNNIVLLLLLALTVSGRSAAEQLTVQKDGREVVIGNIQSISQYRFKLDLPPKKGRGFCRMQSLLFDERGGIAVPQDRSVWLVARADGSCEGLPANSYVEFEELEPTDIHLIDQFLEAVISASRNERLGGGVKFEDPRHFVSCLAGGAWRMNQLYQSPVSSDLIPEVVMRVQLTNRPKGCSVDTLFLRGRFDKEGGDLIISILSDAAIIR